MERKEFLVSSVLGSVALGTGDLAVERMAPKRHSRDGIRKILIAGGGFGTAYIRYMAELTGKERPKLLYLPTASADSDAGMIRWFQSCAPLDLVPSVQRSFISSYSTDQSWEEIFLSVVLSTCCDRNGTWEAGDRRLSGSRDRIPFFEGAFP